MVLRSSLQLMFPNVCPQKDSHSEGKQDLEPSILGENIDHFNPCLWHFMAIVVTLEGIAS